MSNISHLAWVQWKEMKGTRNFAHSPNMSIIGVEEGGLPVFGLIQPYQGLWTKRELLHWAVQHYGLDRVYELHRTIRYLVIIFPSHRNRIPLIYCRNGSFVIYKGGTSKIAQMSRSSIEEMLGILKYSRSQNMRIYGGENDSFSIFGRGSSEQNIQDSIDLLPQ